MKPIQKNRSCGKGRSGSLTVEFALVLPLIFVFFFGAWEWSRVEMIKQVAETASFEAARLGKIPGSTNSDVEDRVEEILGLYMVQSPVVVANVTSTTSHVWVDIPLDENTWISSRIFAGKSVTTSTTLSK